MRWPRRSTTGPPCARDAGRKGEAWPKLVAVARAADPDPDRDALRSALAVEDKSQRLKQIRPLADRAKAEAWSPASLVLLASTLADSGDVDDGVASSGGLPASTRPTSGSTTPWVACWRTRCPR